MKNVKLFFLAFVLVFTFSCADDRSAIEQEVSIESIAEETYDVSTRGFCDEIDNILTLNQALDAFAANLNPNFPGQAGNSLYDDWRRLICAIDAANGPVLTWQDCNRFPSACRDIGVTGAGVGLPCNDFLNMAYCRLRCYVRDYTTNPTPVGLTNIKVAFCDYLLSMNNCVGTTFDLDRYCGL